MRKKHIFFDLDGTLLDSGMGIAKSVQYSLAKMGIIEEDYRSFYKFVGPPLEISYKKYYGFDRADYLEVLKYFQEYYFPIGIYEAKEYEGIKELLAKLKNASKKIYVATSKPELQANRVLKHFGLSEYFDFIGGADDDEVGKRTAKTEVIKYVMEQADIEDRDDIVMIGDKSYDIVGAKNNELCSIAVLYGYGSEEELSEADYKIRTVVELGDLLLG